MTPENNILFDKKEWVDIQQISFLFGDVTQRTLNSLRHERKITYARHPLKKNEFIYRLSELQEMVQHTIVPRKTI